ncbi:GNAT family N-acetyltransferase [Arthrobacter sp. H-02-3]|uniref:GNAT family N-acetyltransferase n=1 Tax=Arthrobacter sp. H-02-3 TaxID=2703675 RepID=UPI000DD21A36|nr:GNAT family N-acetyltransferase [Arthrobacter sp. H-02-3]PVZ59576.1 GNAT family N-acetyltransferase [Arthrobacter sp. H-02-3]
MSPSAEPVPAVELLDVSEAVLEQLLELALRDADADEVTPPLGESAAWNTDRISWFREFHHAAAAGLDGPAQQKSWAISCDGQLAGSVRLKRIGPGPGSAVGTMKPLEAGAGGAGAGGAGAGGALETGIWLGRSFRGRGVGREALRLVKALAVSAGASHLVAETTAGNVGAIALLKSAGAELVTGAASATATMQVKGTIPLR